MCQLEILVAFIWLANWYYLRFLKCMSLTSDIDIFKSTWSQKGSYKDRAIAIFLGYNLVTLRPKLPCMSPPILSPIHSTENCDLSFPYLLPIFIITSLKLSNSLNMHQVAISMGHIKQSIVAVNLLAAKFQNNEAQRSCKFLPLAAVLKIKTINGYDKIHCPSSHWLCDEAVQLKAKVIFSISIIWLHIFPTK